jgi:cytochrome c biogenesis protein CcmG/thiol:disulfide interchange protein DsbE
VDEPVTPERAVSWRFFVKAGVFVVMAALVGLLAWATLAAGQGRSLVQRIAAGEEPPAPAFELGAIWPEDKRWPADLAEQLEDGDLSVEELRGRPAVINFWASWCIPCREEAPILAASARAHEGEVRFIGVNIQDLRADALSFLREFEVPYVSVRDKTNATYQAYGLTGVPETYYLDARGRIVAHSLGAVSRSELEDAIARATELR